MKRGSFHHTLGVLSLLLAFALAGCGEHPSVTIYDRNLTRQAIPCLALKVFPPDPAAERTMHDLYPFTPDCPYSLTLSTKAGIHCNSNANAPLKTTSNFPSAYLRLELHYGMRLLYSYYIDLTSPPDASDIRAAFDRLKDDLKFSKK